jgi:hypothetical protein
MIQHDREFISKFYVFTIEKDIEHELGFSVAEKLCNSRVPHTYSIVHYWAII